MHAHQHDPTAVPFLKSLRPRIYWGPVSDLRGEDDCFFQESCSGQVSPAAHVLRTCPTLRRTGQGATVGNSTSGQTCTLGFLRSVSNSEGQASPKGGFQNGNTWGIKNRCKMGQGCEDKGAHIPPTKTQQFPMLITQYWETPTFWNCGISPHSSTSPVPPNKTFIQKPRI